jgi:hypothetical protein
VPFRPPAEAQGLCLPFRPLAGLAQDEELRCAGREARSARGLGPVESFSVASECQEPCSAEIRGHVTRLLRPSLIRPISRRGPRGRGISAPTIKNETPKIGLGDKAPEWRVRRHFPHTETKRCLGNAAVPRRFERSWRRGGRDRTAWLGREDSN